MSVNIAIDGPAGAGKSTIAKQIARDLGIVYVDTGAMYRALGLYFHRRGIDSWDEAAIGEAVEQAEVTIGYEEGRQQVYLNGENVTPYLRSEEAGKMASATSVYPKVRRKLVALQQQLAASTDVIMDGRDIGTVVLPHADVKIFLTADSHERALRRYKELLEKGEEADLAAIEKDIVERDERDMHRAESPLRQAEDAVLVDTSHMTIDEVAEAIIQIYQEACTKRI